MSDIIQQSTDRCNTQKRRPKKLSTKVDLTPMVDLGFLLITFFIFTATLSRPNILKLAMPKDDTKVFTPVKISGAMTILLSGEKKIYFYFGKQLNEIHEAGYLSIRDALLAKKKITKADDMFVIIKAGGTATYKNAIDILNELTISDVKRYAIADLQPDELEMISKYEKRSSTNL